MQGPQPPQEPVTSRSPGGPEVLGFFHAENDVSDGYLVSSADDLRAATQRVTDQFKTLCGMTTRLAFAA